MKKQGLLESARLVYIVVFSLILSACTAKQETAAPAAAAPAKKIEITMVDWQNPGHFFVPALERFAKRVTERTDGQLTIKLVKATALGMKWENIISSLKAGSPQMSSSATFYLSGQTPLVALGWIPLFVENIKEMSLATLAVEEIFQEELNKFGVQLLAHWPYDEQVLVSSVPINKVSDFKKLRIRATGAEFAGFVQALGATPVSMPISEVYTSAQRGLINGYSVGWDTHRNFGIWEVFNNVLDFSFNTGSQVVLISKGVYDSLPGESKAILLEEVKTLSAAEYVEAVMATSRGKQALKDKKMAFSTADEQFRREARAAAKTVLESWGAKSPVNAKALKRIQEVLGR